MTTTPTGGTRPPLSSLDPNASERLAPSNVSMTDGVLSTPMKTRTSRQRLDYPGASLQNCYTISPVQLARVYDLPSGPLDKPKTPLTEQSKAKTNSNPELDPLAKRLFSEEADPQKREQRLREKLDEPSNKVLGKLGREAISRIDATLSAASNLIELRPSDIFCLPVQSCSEPVAIRLSKFAGGDKPLDSIKSSKLNQNTEQAIADKNLLKSCLGELFGDFDPSGDLSVDQMWAYLRGAREPSGKNPQEVFHDKRNFLITVVQFNDGSQLKFFSVSGSPPIDEGATEVSYTMLGACNPSNPTSVRVPLLPNAPEEGRVAIEANYEYLEPVPNAKFIHLSYADISTKIGGVDYEMREVPRTILCREAKKEKPEDMKTFQALDRARDTEFVVLNALAAIKKAYPGKFDQSFNITMFSKLKMCASCHWAATYSRTSALFGNHGDFRIYGADELPQQKFEEMRQKLDTKK